MPDLRPLRRTAFIAMIAMLMMVLAPTASKMVAAEVADSELMAVCTAEGTTWVSVSEPGPSASLTPHQAPASEHDHGGDCPYCSLQTVQFWASISQTFATAQVASPLPVLFYRAPQPLFAWAHARSRAPPLSA